MASKFLMNQAIQDAEAIDQGAGIPATGVVPQNMRQYFAGTNPGAYGSGDWRSNMNQSYNWPDSGARYEYNRPYNMRGVAGEVGEYGQIPGQGNADMVSQKQGFNFPNFGVLGLLNKMKDQFQYKGAEGEAWDSQTGQMISAEDQDRQNALGGWYSQAAKDARLQDKRVARMLARKEAGKGFSQSNLTELQGLGYGPEEKIKETIKAPITAQGDQVNTGGGGGSQQTFKQTSPAGISQAQSRAARGNMSGWKLAQGGRAGYQGGELVEQETDFIEGPQGGEEFQETVVEGQEQPSREQLEALAMEIFQLPLEELDEQQLLVVYQEAMQGQPMEEAVQEEDVQYAAQGGLAGLL